LRKQILYFLIMSFFLAPGWNSCGEHPTSKGGPRVLENDSFRVELSPDRPLIRSYTDKRSGTVFGGDSASTGWVVNGRLYPWSEWIITSRQDSSYNYRLS
jgi:hypothetical protein